MLLTTKLSSKIFFTFFNRYSPDLKYLIQENMQLDRIIQQLKLKKLLTLVQTHGTEIVDVENLDTNSSEYLLEEHGDGSISIQYDIALGIQTADCVPVLLFCKMSNIIAAAHCGWRGTRNNIIQIIANKMRLKGASQIFAIIGPAIQQKSYIVRDDLLDIITKDNPKYKEFFVFDEIKQKIKFDLPSFVEYKLYQEDIDVCYRSKEDTFTMSHKYPSYRYELQRNRKHCHYILSMIFARK